MFSRRAIKAARASSYTGRRRRGSGIASTIFFEAGRIVVERAGLQEPVREAPPEDHLPWLQRLVLQQSLKKLVSQRSRAEDEHESMRAGLRVHHSGVTFGIECDNALKNGGFAGAREGVDDMDWGRPTRPSWPECPAAVGQ